MIVIPTVNALREELRAKGGSIGFVPTMGALHAGHARLLEVARPQNDRVVASIFVNPLQFDRPDDLARYPRTLDADLQICSQAGVDVVFTPKPEELYPQAQLTFVEVPALCGSLCGTFRPGHFKGVCTVVLKLFNIVGPTRAYFGQKDAQQLAIIQRMVQDLDVPVEIVPVPTVREPDGLALSSRNRLLSSEERAEAPKLYQALQAVTAALDAGERITLTLREIAERILAGIRIEYFEFVDPSTLVPVERIDGPVLIAAAVWLGSTRLIDNVTWPSK
jgi:pantoate--beta-alanine ligase